MHSARYSCQILVKLEFFRQIFEKKNNSKIMFHESLFSGSRADCSMRMDAHTGMTKLLVASHDFAKAPKSWKVSRLCFLPRQALNCLSFIRSNSTMACERSVGRDLEVNGR
jgi:hypothetical protein